MTAAADMVLRVRAPFAAFRWLQAGVYRATSPVIPPSAAWGLVLNLAGVDVRGDDKDGVTTIRSDAPALEIAIGRIGIPEVATLYQQLHTYPVGASGKERKERSHGAKYWIAPARRELLVDFDCLLAVRGKRELLAAVTGGLRGKGDAVRYGLPHAGDNNLMLDRVDVVDEVPRCEWYARLREDDPPRRGSCRLTVSIDRSDSSNTRSAIYAPLAASTGDPPDGAWTWVPRPPQGAPVE